MDEDTGLVEHIYKYVLYHVNSAITSRQIRSELHLSRMFELGSERTTRRVVAMLKEEAQTFLLESWRRTHTNEFTQSERERERYYRCVLTVYNPYCVYNCVYQLCLHELCTHNKPENSRYYLALFGVIPGGAG